MFSLLNTLDPDLKQALLQQLRNLWTHSSTAIEGNTLTLGETAFVLEQGLTISGKPLKDHQEVVGHARAIDLLYDLLRAEKSLDEQWMSALHRAVQNEVLFDVYKPVGGWKIEPNSTVAVVNDSQVVFEYGLPAEIPDLMKEWFALYQQVEQSLQPDDKRWALQAYVRLHVAFVRIHPFFDGNGRMARLIANLPVLRAGLPPVVIPVMQRKAYIDALADYHHQVGQIRFGNALLPCPEQLEPFSRLCEQAWQESIFLVETIQEKQQERNRKKL
jgi:Fic family protein